MNATLEDLGYGPFFQAAFDGLAQPTLKPARVVREDRGRYQLADGGQRADGRPLYLAEPVGRLLHGGEGLPAVGDWVAADLFDDGTAVVHACLPRRSAFVRGQAGRRTGEQCVAANIDTLFVATGLDRDFNLRRIERYLVVGARSGAATVIVLTKADCDPAPQIRVEQVRAIAGEIPVIALSARQSTGLTALDPWLERGQTVAFVGSSGVGKSTLINALLGQPRIATKPVRSRDGRGQHTTTHRELLVLPSKAAVIDTPGMRELRLWCDPEALQIGFPDIDALADDCRFRDCQHSSEPGCAVEAAVQHGELAPERLQSWHKLRAEMAYTAERQAAQGDHEARKRGRQFAKMAAEAKRLKGNERS